MTSQSAMVFLYDSYLKLLHSKTKSHLWIKLLSESLDWVCCNLKEYSKEDFHSITSINNDIVALMITERAAQMG